MENHDNDIGSLRQSLEIISNQIQSYTNEKPPDNDECIFHYTDAAGLIGIVNDNKIRATNFRFLNDPKEFMYGFGVIASLIKKEFSNNQDPLLAELLDGACAGQHSIDLFVACFSEDYDDLSQWRLYGDGGQGYSIGIRKSDLESLLDTSSAIPLRFRLSRVIYDREKQEAAFKMLINHTAELARKLGKTSPNSITECKHFIGNEIMNLCASIKHPAFHSEREWRLICLTSPRSENKISFRAGRFGLTPYITFPDTHSVNGKNHRLKIHKVFYGAKHDHAMAFYALSRLIPSSTTTFFPSSCPIK